MPARLIDADPLTLAPLVAWARSRDQFVLAPAAPQRLAADRAVVERHAAAGIPVYGLNTGLGGNLDYRLADDAVQFADLFASEPIVATLSRQLSWLHFLALIPVKDALARDFYAQICQQQGWSVRT